MTYVEVTTCQLFLNYDGCPTPEYTPRWNFKKYDWDQFKNKCNVVIFLVNWF